jgi:hypothetical protein
MRIILAHLVCSLRIVLCCCVPLSCLFACLVRRRCDHRKQVVKEGFETAYTWDECRPSDPADHASGGGGGSGAAGEVVAAAAAEEADEAAALVAEAAAEEEMEEEMARLDEEAEAAAAGAGSEDGEGEGEDEAACDGDDAEGSNDLIGGLTGLLAPWAAAAEAEAEAEEGLLIVSLALESLWAPHAAELTVGGGGGGAASRQQQQRLQQPLHLQHAFLQPPTAAELTTALAVARKKIRVVTAERDQVQCKTIERPPSPPLLPHFVEKHSGGSFECLST